MIFFITILIIVIFLLRYNFFRIPKKGLVVLLYHSISEKKSNTSLDKFTIDIKKFENQIRFLKYLGYKTIRASQIEEFLNNQLYNNGKYVLITFDDGYKNNLEAAKCLKKYNYSGIFFILSNFIDKSLDNTPMLSRQDIKNLILLGMEIGSHSHDHLKLSDIPKEDLIKQVTLSKTSLSEFTEVDDFAYPFGNCDEYVVEKVKEGGFKRAYIIGQSINTKSFNPYKINRSIIRRSTNYLDLYLILTRGRSRL